MQHFVTYLLTTRLINQANSTQDDIQGGPEKFNRKSKYYKMVNKELIIKYKHVAT